MDDLAEQSEVHYGTLEGTAIQTFFREQFIPPYPRMYNFMVEYKTWVPNSSVGTEKVFNSYNIPKGKRITVKHPEGALNNSDICEGVPIEALQWGSLRKYLEAYINTQYI